MSSTQDIINLTKQLVAMRTTSSRPHELQTCSDFFVNFFKDTPLTVETFSHQGIPSLFISKGGKKRPKILFYAHFDVVDGDDNQFEVIEKDSKLFGRGVFDMKGATAIFALIMKEYATTTHDIGFMLVGDEEVGGIDGAQVFAEQGYGGDMILMPDGGMAVNRFTTKEKGVLRFKLMATGKAVHSSVPWNGESAIDKLIRAIDKIQKLFVPFDRHPEDHWVETFTVGEIHGGVAFNQVPDVATAHCDVRFTELQDGRGLIDTIQGMLPAGVTLKLELYCPANAVPIEHPLFQTFVRCVERHGRESIFAVAHGSSDARYFADQGMPMIISQPDGGDHHGLAEWVSIEGLELYDRVVREYIDEVAIS